MHSEDYKDPTYYDVRMSVEEMWQVVRALFGDQRCEHPDEQIIKWCHNMGGLPGHLMELIEKYKLE